MIIVIAGLVLFAIVLALRGESPAGAAERAGADPAAGFHAHATHAASHAAVMDDESMKAAIAAWYASHPEHGGVIAAAATDTFLVGNFFFNTDGNTGTQIDTAKIEVGQTILFKWQAGAHTTTSGNPGDLDAGSLWDHSIDNFNSNNLEFVVAFPNAGTFPFFCSPHGAAFNMKGVVVVNPAPVSVPPGLPATTLGFSRPPAPNPSRGDVAFEFRTGREGGSRLEVFDTGGRRVAIVLNRMLPSGTHSARWNGRNDAGARVEPGVYYVRLTAPGIDQARSVAIER